MGGAVLVDGYIYGSGDASRTWQCLDWNTGEQKYSSKAIAKGVTIYADGMLYCYSERGELALVKADPSGFNIISKTKVTLGSEQHWAHPVINNGILYVRHGDALIAYKIK
jgi:outer membrane protein assembly factor BamB